MSIQQGSISDDSRVMALIWMRRCSASSSQSGKGSIMACRGLGTGGSGQLGAASIHRLRRAAKFGGSNGDGASAGDATPRGQQWGWREDGYRMDMFSRDRLRRPTRLGKDRPRRDVTGGARSKRKQLDECGTQGRHDPLMRVQRLWAERGGGSTRRG